MYFLRETFAATKILKPTLPQTMLKMVFNIGKGLCHNHLFKVLFSVSIYSILHVPSLMETNYLTAFHTYLYCNPLLISSKHFTIAC